MTLNEKPFWWDTLNQSSLARPTWPTKVDVAIIGGGLTGLSAARALAKRGTSVAVLEAESFGWGASSRNGGMVLPGLKLGVGAVTAKYGRELAQRMYAASVEAVDCVEQVVREEKIACDFERVGHLYLAYKPAHFERLAHSAEVLRRDFKRPVRLVPKSELQDEIASPLYHGGLVDETSAGVNPARYVAGLAEAASRAGAAIFDGARVTRLERAGTTFKVQTPLGELQARAVFVATSGYTGPLTPALRKLVIPIGSYIIATEPLTESVARGVSPRRRMMYDSKNFLYYFRLTPDKRMLFGGRAVFGQDTPSTIRESAAILERGMLEVYPQLRGVKVEYAWGGLTDFAFDMMPHTGERDGVYYALGYAGHGVALATYLGAQVAGRILGEPTDNPFDNLPAPGAPLGLYNGVPWFLPFAGWWYKFLDWVS